MNNLLPKYFLAPAGAETAKQSTPHLSSWQHKTQKVTLEHFLTGQRGLSSLLVFYNWWKETFNSLEAQGWLNETAVGQLPQKAYKSMAASRLLIPRLHQHRHCHEATWRTHLLLQGALPFPLLMAYLSRTRPVLMHSCLVCIFQAFLECLTHTVRTYAVISLFQSTSTAHWNHLGRLKRLMLPGLHLLRS